MSDYSEVEEHSDKIAEVKALFGYMAGKSSSSACYSLILSSNGVPSFVGKVGIALNTKSFPWKSLTSTLSKPGFVLHNYPEDVPFPNKRDTKGIACLTVKQAKRLIDAFRLSEHPMKLVKSFNDQGVTLLG